MIPIVFILMNELMNYGLSSLIPPTHQTLNQTDLMANNSYSCMFFLRERYELIQSDIYIQSVEMAQ